MFTTVRSLQSNANNNHSYHTESAAPIPIHAPWSTTVRKSWKRGLFDCYKSSGMCCVVTGCFVCTVGQIFSISQRGSAARCIIITMSLIVLVVLSNCFLNASTHARRWLNWDSFVVSFWFAVTGMTLQLVACLVVAAVVCRARANIRAHHCIEENTCSSDVEDGCCSMFCAPCVVCQLFAQENIEVCSNNDNTVYQGVLSTYSTI